MFKTSSVIQLARNSDALSSKSDGNDDGFHSKPIDLTDVERIQVLNFPTETVSVDSEVNFVLKKNGVKGDLEVLVQCPTGTKTSTPIQYLDHERVSVTIRPRSKGVYKVHIKCNSVELPGSPYLIVVTDKRDFTPVFNSDASKVTLRGDGVERISLHSSNEFIVDGSEAGCNILFVGICGPRGPSEEISIKKISKNSYKVSYFIKDTGEYVLAVKWGEEHVPGSPFLVLTN
ncbi:FLNC family protein [Megaselia abdita]